MWPPPGDWGRGYIESKITLTGTPTKTSSKKPLRHTKHSGQKRIGEHGIIETVQARIDGLRKHALSECKKYLSKSNFWCLSAVN